MAPTFQERFSQPVLPERLGRDFWEGTIERSIPLLDLALEQAPVLNDIYAELGIPFELTEDFIETNVRVLSGREMRAVYESAMHSLISKYVHIQRINDEAREAAVGVSSYVCIKVPMWDLVMFNEDRVMPLLNQEFAGSAEDTQIRIFQLEEISRLLWFEFAFPASRRTRYNLSDSAQDGFNWDLAYDGIKIPNPRDIYAMSDDIFTIYAVVPDMNTGELGLLMPLPLYNPVRNEWIDIEFVGQYNELVKNVFELFVMLEMRTLDRINEKGAKNKMDAWKAVVKEYDLELARLAKEPLNVRAHSDKAIFDYLGAPMTRQLWVDYLRMVGELRDPSQFFVREREILPIEETIEARRERLITTLDQLSRLGFDFAMDASGSVAGLILPTE